MVKKIQILKIVCVAIAVFLFQGAIAADAPDDLMPNERNNIAIFQRISPLVVNVHKINNYIDPNFELLRVETGMGSGFIWDNAGHVVTNYHVISHANEVAVSLGKGKTVRAKIVGVYPRKDIAVLQLTSQEYLKGLQDFQHFPIADSAKLQVGQDAIAIGNPFGFDHTLTHGVISALDREVPTHSGLPFTNLIQTDASINPGNSGGPLLNSSGKLIGMNTMIFSPSGSSAGIGFAIPSNDIERVVDQIIKYGKVTQPGIGVQVFNDAIAQQLGIVGVLINKVLPNSPAAVAGLRGTTRDADGNVVLGDIIVGLNGQKITSYQQLLTTLEQTVVNSTITLTILRDGKEVNVSLKTANIGF